ncbi:glycerol kinase GlpK [Vogesella sp. LIG4]|uniref:glycerol kinase GlpK n=1 Tax=Vogesella sp. LIG4 TaxID=1192162 RepID=UPI00081FA077|nr:glycerol kinase GlpK [Vogesella sp. LIG4]SCK18393.1 glycerol kinase [Vogesella sp. LIG4]
MQDQYILAFDQGTTSSRAILFDRGGNIVSAAQKEFRQIYPQAGWVEHDPLEIWAGQVGVAAEALARAGIPGSQVAAIGITNQRETTVVWDRETGLPVYNAIVWQDRRTAAFCDEIRARGLADSIRDKTGLLVDAYFSATKVRWILENVPGARARAEAGKLAFGTIDSWLIWQLTHGQVHVTDVSNASRTMLYNIHTLQWDAALLDIFGIPASMLPAVKSSSEVYGHTHAAHLGVAVPIAGVAGDQQAALFGQQCTRPGMVKNTYGTGCFMMMNTGDTPIASHNQLLTTIAWQLDGKVQYALEGSIFIGGSVVKWLRDGLGIIKQSSDVGPLAAQVADSDGVYLVPAFAGLGAPHWNANARGTLVGMTQGTGAAHIARAALDSIAFQTMDVLGAMQADAGITIAELRVDGGASVNNVLMQFQSDILGTNVARPKITETTALGAAYLAGLAVGYWQGTDDIQGQWQLDTRFEPALPQETVQRYVAGWQRATRSAINWANDKA